MTKIISWLLRVVFLGDFPGKNLPLNAGDLNLIPGQRTKVAYAVWCGKKKRKKLYS